ncbi:MAG: Ig domain-containing protein, partial [Poseidonia sp.]
FINITTGNGSSWSTPAGTFMPWASSCLHHVDNGTLYTAATNGTGASPTFYGYGLDNETAWVINSSIFAPGCYKFIGYGGMTSWHGAFSMAYGTSLYFEAKEGTWDGLFGYGLENGTVWRESSNELEITSSFTAVVDDVLYFGAYHNSSVPSAMHAHNLSNGTTWLVLNASNGSPIQTYWTYAGGGRASVVGDVFFYYTYINSNFVYWAYNTSNGSAWEISSQVSSGGGPVLDGVLYYSRGTNAVYRSLYAYNVSNETSWQVHTRWGLNDIHEMDGVLYYGARSTTNSYTSLWAHNPDNGTTWEIGGTSQNNYFGFLDAGGTLFYRVHSGNSNERDLWAYEPSNTTAWQVTNIPLNGDTFTSLGNTVYFTSESTTISGEHDLWAYNTANETTWFVTNISTTNWGFTSSGSVHHPESTSLVFAGDTLYIREGGGMRSHQPASINYQTNTGGNVTTWAINASLPSGLTFSTTNGSIYGTPTELWTQTSYMVWANNSGGSSVAYLNITVVDELPTLSYSPSTLVLTINTSSSDLPLNATLTGSGTITSWAISPALPNGLSFGTSNGTIWGTPTSLMTLKTFTIWANNSGGSSSATVNITVNDEAPDISYSPDWFVLTNNTAMSPTATPTNSGGAIPSGIIDSDGNVGEYTSIAIDSNGFKHISYYGGGDLKYATDTSGSWVVTTVDTSARRESTSIAIDSNDAVHISYQGSGNLKYATCSSSCATASNWDLVSVDTTSTNVGEYGSIAIDSNDTIHISYFDNGNNDLKYA